jgi:TP901 family phage tail tape measure protein
MAVTGAGADKLTSSVTVAATAFNFDLAKRPGGQLLDKMTLAGRKGNAELENLADIFARVGVNAAAGGMGFEQTLAFIEGLSLIERQPERLATLADSTLRLFANLNYAKEAAKATGVRFFDQKTGERRNPMDVLKDLKKEYDKLGTDKERALFMRCLRQGRPRHDQGLHALFGGDMLTKVQGFTGEIRDAGGTLQRDLPKALSNAVDPDRPPARRAAAGGG